MPFLSGHNSKIKLTGTDTSITDEPCTEVSATVFQITDATKRILPPSSTFVVDVDASTVSASTYTIDYLFGTITFDSSQTGSTVTITGDYKPTSDWLNGREFNLSLERVELDKTVFQDKAVGRTSGTPDLNASLEVLDDGLTDLYSGTSVNDLLDSGDAFVLEFDLDGTGTYLIRVWVRVQQDDVGTSVEDLVVEGVTLVSALQKAAMTTQQSKLWSHNLD